MTTTQITSMKPTARAAPIYSLPALMLLRKACRDFTTYRARGPSRSNHSGRESGQGRFLSKIDDVKRGKSHDRRGDPDAEHVTHIMSGHALPRLLGRHDGARAALPSSEFWAVLRRAHGDSPTLGSFSWR